MSAAKASTQFQATPGAQAGVSDRAERGEAQAGTAGDAAEVPATRQASAAGQALPPPLPHDRLERVEAWGMNTAVMAYVYRPGTVAGIREVFETARRHGVKVGLRGAGRSYGDASLAAENICLDLTRMNRILEWDPATGVIAVEPGVTLRQLWQYAIGDGWWPPVVSGTMYVSMGGAAGMNFHGKNNFKMGPIGDHILEFELLTPAGETRVCSREQNRDLFHAAIGGFGMLGCFTRITLQLKKVESGLLSVYAFSTQNFAEIIREFEARMDAADYLVGWIDCFARGRALGRGLVHQANYLHADEDPDPVQTLRVESQELPDTLFGLLPKSVMWRFVKPFANNPGMRLLNAAKFTLGNTRGNRKTVRQSHAGFAFLLDYVPNWKFAYKPGGLIQYQSFVPAANAEACFSAQIKACQEEGIVPYLGVFKRHRRDDFLMTHSVDGYSLALDFPVTARSRKRLWELTAKLNALVLAAGGRFYFAKDSTLDSNTAAAYLGEETLRRFFDLKRACDPEGLLQTNLSQRLFAEYSAEQPLSQRERAG
jgi:decaprenylphospho-beta-D-ribofuranose 2-oxidase